MAWGLGFRVQGDPASRVLRPQLREKQHLPRYCMQRSSHTGFSHHHYRLAGTLMLGLRGIYSEIARQESSLVSGREIMRIPCEIPKSADVRRFKITRTWGARRKTMPRCTQCCKLCLELELSKVQPKCRTFTNSVPARPRRRSRHAASTGFLDF